MRYFAYVLIFLIAGLTAGAQAQPPAQPEQPQDVPSVNGEAGPCSAEFTVVDAEGKPVFSAMVKVHITYGFAGARKLDLSVYTNAQGKTKFTGLPARVHKPPIEFRASKDRLEGMVALNPESECQATHDIVIRKSGG
jgi:hypothetical protein